MIRLSIAAASMLLLSLAAARGDELPALPNPIATPGAVERSATLDVIRRGRTRDRRHVTHAMKMAALPRAEAPFYEVDHLIPLAIGDANSSTNLWPQPWAEADQKDVLEIVLQRQVCAGLLPLAKAQAEVADDWTAAYTRYVGGVPMAAPGYDGPMASTAPPARIGIRARLKADVWRLARRWMFGER